MPRAVRMSLYLLFLVALHGLPAPLSAQDVDPAARFLIETITVEGIERGSARAIVAAETRLREGETYSEPALRQAIYRVKRLPFVLDAEMSLRRGSERGAYELVITVEPTRPVFFLAETGGGIASSGAGDRFAYSSSASVGVRQFLGASGLLFASVDKRESSTPSYQAGYTHYNLAGAGTYASVGVAWARAEESSEDFESTLMGVELGFPLTASQSLRSSFSWSLQTRDFEVSPLLPDEIFEVSSRTESWDAGLAWTYDTTDDPVLPSQGDKVTGGVGYDRTESRTAAAPPFRPAESSAERWSWSLSGRRHVRLTPRQSVALGAQTFWQRREAEADPPVPSARSFSAVVEGLHSVSLWGFEKTERIGDLRLESRLSVDYSHAVLGRPGGGGSETGAALTTSLVFRNAWGILRASLSYAEDDL